MDDSIREDGMTEDTFDGIWTLIIGDEDANSKTNTKIVVRQGQAWNAASPADIGTCAIADGRMTITLRARGVDGQDCSERIIAQASGRHALSGVLHVTGPDGIDFCDPCLLVRKMGLSFRAPVGAAVVQASRHAA